MRVLVTPDYTPMKHDTLIRVKKCRECGVEFHQAASDSRQYQICKHCKWVNNYGWSDSNFKGLRQLHRNLEKKFWCANGFFGSYTNKRSWYHFSRAKDSNIIKIWENDIVGRTGSNWCAVITVMQWFTAIDTMVLLSETIRKASINHKYVPTEYVSYLEDTLWKDILTPAQFKTILRKCRGKGIFK